MISVGCRSHSPQTETIHFSQSDSLHKDSLVRRMFEIRYNTPDEVPYLLGQIRTLEQKYNPDIANLNYYSSQVFLYSNIKKIQDSARIFLDSQLLMLKHGMLKADNLKAKTAFSKAIYYQGIELNDSAIHNALYALDMLRNTSDTVLLYNIYGTI